MENVNNEYDSDGMVLWYDSHKSQCQFLPLIPHLQLVSFPAVFLVGQIHGLAGTREPHFLATGH